MSVTHYRPATDGSTPSVNNTYPQWGTVAAEIKVPSFKNPELTNVLPLKLGLGQNITTHTSPTARNLLSEFLASRSIHLHFS